MKNKSVALALVSLLLCGMLLFSGCGSKGNISSQKDEKIIYATTAPVYDFTRKIAGDKKQVKLIVSEDAHQFEMTANQMAKISESSAIVYNGLGLEPFVEEIIETNKSIRPVFASENVTTIQYGEFGKLNNHPPAVEEDHDDNNADDHDDGHDHDDMQFDPHVWLYPINAKQQMKNICNFLCETDRENEEYYKKNYEEYAKKCDELDGRMQKLKGKTIVSTHNAYVYWEKMYGIKVLAMDSAGAEVSPAKMKEFVAYCRDNNIKTVYYEAGESDKTAQALAKEINGQVRELNAFEGIKNGKDDYFNVMDENIKALSE